MSIAVMTMPSGVWMPWSNYNNFIYHELSGFYVFVRTFDIDFAEVSKAFREKKSENHTMIENKSIGDDDIPES